MQKWIWIIVLMMIVLALACSREKSNRPECETPDEQAVSIIETGLAVEGISLHNARAVRSRAYEKLWFLAAEVRGVELAPNRNIAIWGVDDLKQPEFIWWANDLAEQYSNWGDEKLYDPATDGMGTARFCTRSASE